MRKEIIRQGLEKGIEALNTWLADYASEFMNEENRKAAQARLEEFGTIAYISYALRDLNYSLAELNNDSKY
jgi:hypothetical protein